MPARRDYYEALGVSRQATADEIKRAYRSLARKLHPDVNKADDAQARFTEIQEAYDVLSDPEKRKAYDRFGHAGVNGFAGAPGSAPGGARGAPGGFHYEWSNAGGDRSGPGVGGFDFDVDDLGSMFDTFFGAARGSRGSGSSRAHARRGPAARAPSDAVAEIRLDFESAARGGRREIRVQRGGETRSIEVMIPPAVQDGAKLRVRGEGAPAPGGRAGDLVLTVRVEPHPVFRRGRPGDPKDTLDLLLELPLTIAEATLGCQLDVPTLEGPVGLTVPPGTSSGRLLRLRGRGLTNAAGRSGDLYARVRILAPDGSSLSPDEARVLRDVAARSGNVRSGPGWPAGAGNAG